MGVSGGPAGCESQRWSSIAKLLESATRSLVNIHSALGVWVQATCNWVARRLSVELGGEQRVLECGNSGAGGVVVGRFEVQ